jgi:23S rRNA pseudouridine1911/1915/1917 synthase
VRENRFHLVCSEEGKRIDVFLSENLKITRTKVKDMIDGGYVRVAGKVPKPSMKIRNCMEIDGEIPEEEPLSLTPQEIPLDILYEDEYFLAVNKPKDMVVHPSFGHREGTLVNAVLAYLGHGEGRGKANVECRMSNFEFDDQQNLNQRVLNSGFHNHQQAILRPGIVHRLDKGTTGVIIVAKDSKTQEMLSALFKKRDIQKTYRAIVEGVLNKKTGIIEGNIGRHPVDRKKMAVLNDGGREASTSFKVIEQLKDFSYIEAYPKTGRTHQIRVHLSHIGHPVAGDDMYGKKAKNITDRPLLHAYRIRFAHPIKGTPIIIEAPIPDDMIDFIDKHNL